MNRKIKSVICMMFMLFIIFVNILCIKAETKEDPFFKYNVVRHAMGGYKNTIYSNHELALKKSIKEGYRFIELDLILTSDNKLVCSHGWDKYSCSYTGIKYTKTLEKNMTYKKFMALKTHNKYATMDAKQWSEYVKKNEDIVWEIDMRTLNTKQSEKTIKELVKLFDGKSKYLDRFLIQVGSEEMYTAIYNVYNFKYFQYFIHKSELEYIDDVLSFCSDNNFLSVAVNYKYMSEEVVKKIKENGLKILCYTIDDKNIAQDMIHMGADTICSNYLSYDDVSNK